MKCQTCEFKHSDDHCDDCYTSSDDQYHNYQPDLFTRLGSAIAPEGIVFDKHIKKQRETGPYRKH